MIDINEKINQPSKPKRIVDRSPAYPSIDLKTSVDLSNKLFDLFSEYGFSREAASEKLGLAQNANTYRKIAALVQYGLLHREGNTYKVTSLGKDIILATDDNIKTALLGTATLKPKIYLKLINENLGKGLPTSLDVRLRQLDYSKDAAKSLAIIFKHSLDYSGLLKNGVVINPTNESNEDMIKDSVNTEQTKGLQNIVPLNISSKENVRHSILPTGTSTKEYIPYPLDCGIIVMFPYLMIKKMMSGTFLSKLNELDKLGKEKSNGTSGNNASNPPVETD